MRIFLLLLLLFAVARADFYGEGSAVITVTDDTWQSVIDSDELWVLEFYAPWCGHCKQLAPHYEKTASNLKGLVKVGAVDCDANPKIQQAMQIKSYPTIRFLPAEKQFNPYTSQAQKVMSEYKGSNNAKELIQAATQLMPHRVILLNESVVSGQFVEDDYPKLLLFTQKSEISSLYKSLSWQFRDKMRFGQTSDTNTELVKQFGVKTFPSIVAIPGDDVSKAVAYTGAIKREELLVFVEQYALKEATADPGTPERRKLLVRIGTDAEFSSSILKDSDKPWLVLFDKKGKSLQSLLLSIAPSLSPSVKIAIVDSAEIAKSQDVSVVPSIRLYQTDKSDVDDCPEEKAASVASLQKWIDDKLTGYVSGMQPGEALNTFLQQKCIERPCIFYFGTQVDVPLLLRLVSLDFHKDIHFGNVPNAPPQVLQQFGVQGKLPRVVLFFSQNGTLETLAAMPYTGNMDSDGLRAFAASVAKKAEAPKSTTTVDRASQPMVEIAKDHPLEKVCAGAGLCAIGFVDGTNPTARDNAVATLEKVKTKKSGSPFRFLYVDAICQSEIAAAFDVTPDKLPTLVVVSPGKLRQRQLMGVFDVESLSTFLDGVVSGKLGTSPFSAMPKTFDGDCSTLHADYRAAMDAGSAPADEDDPIMREVLAAAREREEEERKRRAKHGDDDDDDDDDEPKKKKKKKKKKAKKD